MEFYVSQIIEGEFSLPSIRWSTLLICVIITALIFCADFTNRTILKIPDGPKPLPFIGNLNHLFRNKKIHLTFDRFREKFGKIYSFQLGPYPAVILNDYDTIHEALVTKADTFSNRPMHMDFVKFTSKGKGLFMQNGQDWKELRCQSVKAMRECSGGKQQLEQLVSEEIAIAMAELEKHQGTPFSLHQLFYKAISNNISSILFGRRSEYSDPEFSTLVHHLNALFATGGFANVFLFLPWYTYPLVPFTQPNLIGLMKGVFFIERYIVKRIREHREAADMQEFDSLITYFLNIAQREDSNLYSDRQILQLIMDLFFAGAETTCTTLLWAFMYLAKHPEIQHKCREEISHVIGCEKSPTYADRLQMPYTEAILCETQRLGNVTPMGVFHSTANTTEFGGYTLPKNTITLTNLYAVHMDPEYWSNPETFNPERFLEDGKLRIPDRFMPFGIGRRACIGEHLAKMEMFLFLTSILQKFTIEIEDSTQFTDLKEAEFGMTLSPKPFRIVANTLP